MLLTFLHSMAGLVGVSVKDIYYPLPPHEIGMWRCWLFDEIEKERGASRQRTQSTLTGLHLRDIRCLESLCGENYLSLHRDNNSCRI